VVTVVFRPRVRQQNSAVQYSPQDLDAAAKQRLVSSGAMRDFLGHVTPRYELALQQNEVMDIFEDEFANLADDEGGTGSSKRNSAITVSARVNVWVKGVSVRVNVCVKGKPN
jgi:hypothetical protein